MASVAQPTFTEKLFTDQDLVFVNATFGQVTLEATYKDGDTALTRRTIDLEMLSYFSNFMDSGKPEGFDLSREASSISLRIVKIHQNEPEFSAAIARDFAKDHKANKLVMLLSQYLHNGVNNDNAMLIPLNFGYA